MITARLTILVGASFLLVGLAPKARAHDSLAPMDLSPYKHSWLPHEHWVKEHWMPYDEARLRELLGVDTPSIYRWLKNDHRTLAELARRRGIDPKTLPARLLASQRGRVSPRVYAVLRDRTKRVLTQGHLAQHVYFHVFHGAELGAPIRRWLGVGTRRWRTLRYERGWTPAQVAHRHGRDPAELRVLAIHALNGHADEGVREVSHTRAQANVMLDRQLRILDCWLNRPAPKFDPDHPFGDPHGGHGRHRRGSRVGVKHPKPARGCWMQLYAEP